MTGAEARYVTEISGALERCGARIEGHGCNRWSFLLSRGAELPATALLDGGWLLFDVPLPESRITQHQSRLWQLLQWNAALPGGAKFAALPAEADIHVRAELPLEDDLDLPRRIAQACAGLKTAAAKILSVDTIRSPFSPGEPAVSPVEGGHSEGVQRTVEMGNGSLNAQFVECNPAADLAAQCRESGWAFAERRGKFVVDLEVPDAFQQAVVEAKPHAVAVSVDVTTSGEPLAMPCRIALALLLLRTCAAVRMVRAVVEDVESGTAARFEVLFSDTPCSAELAHAFSALSVACRIAGREAVTLQHDETVAREYLKSVSPGSWIIGSREVASSKRTGDS